MLPAAARMTLWRPIHTRIWIWNKWPCSKGLKVARCEICPNSHRTTIPWRILWFLRKLKAILPEWSLVKTLIDRQTKYLKWFYKTTTPIPEVKFWFRVALAAWWHNQPLAAWTLKTTFWTKRLAKLALPCSRKELRTHRSAICQESIMALPKMSATSSAFTKTQIMNQRRLARCATSLDSEMEAAEKCFKWAKTKISGQDKLKIQLCSKQVRLSWNQALNSILSRIKSNQFQKFAMKSKAIWKWASL